MKIDAKGIVADLKQAKSDKRKISLYLSGAIYESFKDKCDAEGVSPSEVAERLMKNFNESLTGHGRSKRS